MLFFLGTCAAVIISGLRASLPWHGSLGQLLARSGLVGGGVILALVAVVLAAIGAMRQMRLDSLRRNNAIHPHWAGPRLSMINAQEEHPFSVWSSVRGPYASVRLPGGFRVGHRL
jgi:hypothetical protein